VAAVVYGGVEELRTPIVGGGGGAAGGGAQIRFGRRAKSIGQSAKTIIVFGVRVRLHFPPPYYTL